ncbi:bromodomain and WD repeat-containing protein 3 isoform X2 [Procambarus clarkii]|uniref:bromodomain and WD repeat-containing protein 3 isoform X2 n=1 Tax=Procambarus clarkii TaxID=6728 RepID=UPI003743AE80
MDVGPSTSRCNSVVTKRYSALEIELNYLIAKYLSAGPCKKAYKALRAEIEENELLPHRYDWLGNVHHNTFDQWDQQNEHIRNDHLLRIVARLGPTINQLVKIPCPAASTLLGTGLQSLLRTECDLWKQYKTLLSVAVRHHGCLPLEPVQVRGPPCLTQAILGRELMGNFNRKHVVTNKFYSRMQLFLRSVGHLSAVYCMLFDRSGKYIITGADDTLVKIWSILDGRLLATLRGASAEISDLAIDSENTLIAAGSCDKIIRVWNLQTLAPIAVLSSHTGMITALQFCPAPDSEGVLVSTGGDGCVAFWTYVRRGADVKFDSKPLKVNERVRPGNAQLICASFSQGGHFLALGGADHFVRVYHLGGEHGVEKLIEMERHQDRVDSIQWCHNGLKFISGSRDGTALVWYYERQQWKSLVLDTSNLLPGISPPSEEIKRLQVTMVGWNQSDEYVITASNDKWLRVWDSCTGELKHILRGHEDNSYVIEAHPHEPRLVLTAAHDGQLMIWDILTGALVWNFKNTIEGQGYGALFDAKWSPDGFTIAATDSHGHLALFGIGHNEKFQQIPKELFFHTDYRPLMRDGNSHVLDEQTQMAPHLMPPPFLVNMDGDPYPPEYQRLVPGREKCRHDQLIPNVLLNANGDQEVIDVALIEFDNAEHAQNAQPIENSAGQRPSIDDMIQRLAQEQDQRIAHDRRPSESREQPGPSGVRERRESSNSRRGERRASSSGPPTDHSYAVAALHDPLSPRATGRVGARRVGDVEGVRQSTGNWHRDPNIKWNRRIIVKRRNISDIKQSLDRRRRLGEMELQLYDEESKKKPEPVRSPVQQHHESEKKLRKKQKKQTHSYSTRSVRENESGPYDHQDSEDGANGSGSSSSGSSSGSEVVNEELQESSSSDEQSTDYSDWTAEAGVNLEPPKRTAHKQKKSPRKRKKKGKGGSNEDDHKATKDDDDDDEEDDDDGEKKSKENKSSIWTTPRSQRKRGPRPNLSEIGGGADEIPEEFRPPEWLTETFPKKAPYFPQMGDELIYFMQGHMLYVEAVMNRKLYTVDKRSLPWTRTSNKLRHQEFVKIIGIKYEIKPPRLCCLKLGILEVGKGKLTTDSFTIKYHDMPDVLDFLILKATYDVAVRRQWRPGDRFRCIIDDAWWLGTVESQESHLPEFQDSMFMCYRVLWDNGERERLSPWDMEIIEDNMQVVEPGGSVAVKQEELEELLYTPQDEEWAGRDPDLECDRISHGLSQVMSLAIAEPFLVPVDLNVYPMYALIIDYPMDLTTIKSRLDNRFYRRINAAQFDVRYIATNTEKFNQKGSNIVRQARIVTELCLELIKDGMCVDPTHMYHELQANFHSPDHSDDENMEGVEEGMSRGPGKGGHSKGLRGRSQALSDNRTWQHRCKDLLRSIFEREDSMPFRYPVDLDRYPDYSQVIDVPMDLTTVREELSANGYAAPHDFAKDMRLIFTNSKNYNTNKRSRIYSMTLRLEAYFEDQIKSILSCHKLQDVPSKASSELRKNTSLTSFGRPVVAPHQAHYSVSATYEDITNLDGDSSDDDRDMNFRQASGKDTGRRSRRVARKKGVCGEEEDDDSGEEYNPRNKPKTVPKAKKKGVATRNRGRVTVQYNEESEDEELTSKVKIANMVKLKKKNVVTSGSDSGSDSSSVNTAGPSVKRTNGQLYGIKSRLKSSSEDELDEKSRKKSNGVNGLAQKKMGALAKRKNIGKAKKLNLSDESDKSSDSNSASDGDSDQQKSIKKPNRGKRKRSSSDSGSGSSSDSSKNKKIVAKRVGRPPNTPNSKAGYGKRTKDESEVEFDDEDLESSSEESMEEEATTKRGRKRGVASGVRRARKIILDGDDEDDTDFIADKDFIDDADLSEEESSSESESDEGSDDDKKPKKKKKKKKKKQLKPKPKTGKKRKTVKSKAKTTKKKKVTQKKKTPVKKGMAVTKKQTPVKRKATTVAKKQSPVKQSAVKHSPVKHSPVKHKVQEIITVNRPGQAPIPYQPIHFTSKNVIVNEVKHKGRVVGRVITSNYDDDDDDSEDVSDSDEESDEYEVPPLTLSKGKGTAIKNLTNLKRTINSDSDSENTSQKIFQKRMRYSDEDEGGEDDDDEDDDDDDDDDDEEEDNDVDISSRGRVRKANTLMRDFI